MAVSEFTHHRWIERVLLRLALIVCRCRVGIVVASLLLTVAGGWYTVENLGFKTSGGDLIAASDAVQSEFLKYQAAFREQEDVVFMVEAGDRAEAAVDALAAGIRRDVLETGLGEGRLFYRIDDAPLRNKAWAFLEPDELRRLAAFAGFAAQLDGAVTLERMLAPIADADAAGAVGEVPEEVAEILQALAAASAGDPVGPLSFLEMAEQETEDSGYLRSAEGKWLLLFFTPLAVEESRGMDDDTLAALRGVVDAVRGEFSELRVLLTGEPVLDADEMETYQADSLRAVALTIVVVFLVFAYVYRSVARPLLKIGVLLCAIVLALAWAAFAVGHLNILSVAFVVMVLGLGDDFAIYVITRFEEERAAGHGPEESVQRSLMQSGQSVIMAGLTVSISFATMVLTGFVGLAEMGIIAGGGILICAVLCLTMLPALLLLQKREPAADHRHYVGPALRRLEEGWLNRGKRVVLVTLGVVVCGVFVLVGWDGEGSLNVRFSHDLLEMQNSGLESVRAVRELNEEQSIFMGLVVVEDLAEVRALSAELLAVPEVSHVVSVLGDSREPRDLPLGETERWERAQEVMESAEGVHWMSSQEVDPAALVTVLIGVEERLAMLAGFARSAGEEEPATQLRAMAFQAGQAAENLAAITDEVVLRRVIALQESLGRALMEQVQWLRSLDVSGPLTIQDLPQAMQERYVGINGEFLIEVFPDGDIADKAFLEAFEQGMRRVAPQATGTPVMLNVFVDLLRASYTQAALYAFGLVALMLVLYFRGWLATGLCLMPLCAGVVIWLAVMHLAGLSFNPANIITLPLIIGIGVDNGILILQRFRHETEVRLFAVSTGRAILMSNCSTMAGFLALGLANHQGIASLGLIMSLGIGCTMLVSLVCLPAAMNWLKRREVVI